MVDMAFSIFMIRGYNLYLKAARNGSTETRVEGLLCNAQLHPWHLGLAEKGEAFDLSIKKEEHNTRGPFKSLHVAESTDACTIIRFERGETEGGGGS
jgi:hypothetical protein